MINQRMNTLLLLALMVAVMFALVSTGWAYPVNGEQSDNNVKLLSTAEEDLELEAKENGFSQRLVDYLLSKQGAVTNN